MLKQIIKEIQPLCQTSMQKVREQFSTIAIPLGSLGKLQDTIVQIAGIQRNASPTIEKRSVVVFCADNGVVAQGVTQCGQEVTAVVTQNLDKGQTSVCKMANHVHVQVRPVDIGVAREVHGKKILSYKIDYGTKDMTQEQAMTKDQCLQAIETGIALAQQCKREGDTLVAVGEMGIGNTTTTAAVTAALTGIPVSQLTGRGAGLSSCGLCKKIQCIEQALALHQPDSKNPIDILTKVGGFDLAGITGFYLGAAHAGLPIVADGVITLAAALCAVRLCPQVKEYILFSHCSSEPASKILLKELDGHPILDAGLHLGEGTGAIAAIGLFDLAFIIYQQMPSFSQIQIEAYQPLN